MLPKITMKAPASIDGGQIHASASGKNYNLDDKGLVTVDSVDVRDLLGMGFVQVPSDGSDASQAALITSKSPTAATEGAQALDEEQRQAGQRTEIVEPGKTSGSGDHGGAVAPHGDPHADLRDPTLKIDAEMEAETRKATGGDPVKPSAQAETGGANQQAATTGMQEKAAEKAS